MPQKGAQAGLVSVACTGARRQVCATLYTERRCHAGGIEVDRDPIRRALDTAKTRRERKTLSHHLSELVGLGGDPARASDPLSGNIVIRRGLSRLTDIQIGVEIGADYVGN